MATDEQWRKAVAEIRAYYDEEFFPPERRATSIDCSSAYLARSVCDQVVRLADLIGGE